MKAGHLTRLGGANLAAGHNEGTSLREDAGYEEKFRDQKTQVRNVAEGPAAGQRVPCLIPPWSDPVTGDCAPGHRPGPMSISGAK